MQGHCKNAYREEHHHRHNNNRYNNDTSGPAELQVYARYLLLRGNSFHEFDSGNRPGEINGNRNKLMFAEGAAPYDQTPDWGATSAAAGEEEPSGC